MTSNRSQSHVDRSHGELPAICSVKQIRIAFVVHGFVIAGLERCIARIINGIDRSRFAPAIISLTNDTPAEQWIEDKNVPIVALNKGSKNEYAVVRRLAATLKELSADIVHSHNWGTLLETTLARRKSGTLIHVHAERGTVGGDIASSGLRRRLRCYAMRWCLNTADAAVSNAVSVAQRVEQLCGFPAARIHIIPNGVESIVVPNRLATRAEIRHELGIPEDAPVIGSIGRLVGVKAFDSAIDALAKLSDRGAHLVVVGEGPQYESLRLRAQEKEVANRVHLVGQRDDIGRWLAAMDVYLNCSLSEGMSQSLVEAMSTGLPLVVTDVGDNSVLALGPPRCGLVVKSKDVSGLATALRMLTVDRKIRAEYSANAQLAFTERFQLQRMVHQYQSFYARLVQTKQH